MIYRRNCEICICACTRKAILDIDTLRQINPDYKCPRLNPCFLYLSQRFLKKKLPVILYTALSMPRSMRVFFCCCCFLKGIPMSTGRNFKINLLFFFTFCNLVSKLSLRVETLGTRLRLFDDGMYRKFTFESCTRLD